MKPNTPTIRSFVLMALMLTSMIAVAADIHVDARGEVRDDGLDAELDTEVRTTDVRDTDTGRELRDTTTQVRDRIRETVTDTRDQLRETDRETRETTETLRREVVDATTQGRVEIRARLEADRAQTYREARVRYSTANEDYAQARRAYVEAEARGEAGLDARKRVALSAVAQLESYLDLLVRRVESSDAYDDAERESVLERLENYREWLEAGRARIDAAQSVEDLSNVIGILRGEWGQVQAFASATAQQSIVAQISNLLVEARTASNRVDARIAVLARAGADVETLESLKARYDVRLEAATEHVMTARRAYSAEPSAQMREIIAESARAARSEISEAYLILREIIEAMREANAGLGVSAQARAEVNV